MLFTLDDEADRNKNNCSQEKLQKAQSGNHF